MSNDDDEESETQQSVADDFIAESFYPDRFSELRTRNPKTGRHTVVQLNRNEYDVGVYKAARRKRPRVGVPVDDGSDVDDDSDDGDKARKSVTAVSRRRTQLGPSMRSKFYNKRSKARILKSPVVQSNGVLNATTLTSSEIAWSLTDVLMVEFIAKRTPIIHSCISTIKNQVIGSGFIFKQNNAELTPSPDFQQYVTQRLIPFCTDVLDAIMLLGVVPILYERDSLSGRPWPYVPKIGTYWIKRHTVAGAERLRFYWRDSNMHSLSWQKRSIRSRDNNGLERWSARNMYEEKSASGAGGGDGAGIYDPTVEIIHGIGYDMTSNGLLGSKVASLLYMADRRTRLHQARQVAEKNAANPPIFTEYNIAGEKQASKAFSHGSFTSASVPVSMASIGEDGAERLAERTYERDAAQREALAGLLRTYEQETGQDASKIFGVRPDEYKTDLGGTSVTQNSFDADGLPTPWQRQFHVSSGRVLRSGPTPHMITDYVNVLTHMDNEVCSVFGVPLTYIQGTSIRAGTDLVASRLHEEIASYKKTCSDILTHVYNSLFLSEDIETYLLSEERAKRRRRGQPELSKQSVAAIDEEDMFITKEIGAIHISFPRNTVDRIDDLEKLYALGYISRKVLCAEIARRNNIEADLADDDNAEDEVPTEMRQMAFAPYADYIRLRQTERMEKRQLQWHAELASKGVAPGAKAPPKPSSSSSSSTSARKPATAKKASESAPNDDKDNE
jgi:hypothetical protein